MTVIAMSARRVSLATLTLGQVMGNVVAHHWRKLMKQLLDRYRPELHYMRGPGPKCRESMASTACTLEARRCHDSSSDSTSTRSVTAAIADATIRAAQRRESPST